MNWIVLALRNYVGESGSCGVEFCGVGRAEAGHFWMVDELAKAVVGLAVIG